MSTVLPPFAYEVHRSVAGNGSFYHTYIKGPPKEKKQEPLYAVRLGQDFLKTTFKKYLLVEELRNEIFSAAKDSDNMSLLMVDENFENTVNSVLVQTLLKKYFVSQHLLVEKDIVMHALLEVYNELCNIRNDIQMSNFLSEELDKFENARKERENLKQRKLKSKQDMEIAQAERAAKYQFGRNFKNLRIQMPISAPSTSVASRIKPKKYPMTSDKFSSYKLTTMEVDTEIMDILRCAAPNEDFFESECDSCDEIISPSIYEDAIMPDAELFNFDEDIDDLEKSSIPVKNPADKGMGVSKRKPSDDDMSVPKRKRYSEEAVGEPEREPSDENLNLPRRGIPENENDFEIALQNRDIHVDSMSDVSEMEVMSDDDIDEENLVGCNDLAGYDIESIPICCHGEAGRYMCYETSFLQILGLDLSDKEGNGRKRATTS